jgi:hypothetical protein
VLKRPSTGNLRCNLVATNGHVIATSFAAVMQAALIPVASSIGTDLKPAVRATCWSTGTGGRADSAATKTYLPAL